MNKAIKEIISVAGHEFLFNVIGMLINYGVYDLEIIDHLMKRFSVTEKRKDQLNRI